MSDLSKAMLIELMAVASECRCAQRSYFANRTGDNLAAAKNAEKKLDDFLARLKSGQNLLFEIEDE